MIEMRVHWWNAINREVESYVTGATSANEFYREMADQVVNGGMIVVLVSRPSFAYPARSIVKIEEIAS